MAKLIAFIGSPSSGKTTLALKTAMVAYMDKRTKNSRIVFLSPDINVPSVAVLFPKDVFTATEEVCSSIHSVLAIVPYSKGIRQQMIDGRLYDHLSDKAYDKKIKTIISKILPTEE